MRQADVDVLDRVRALSRTLSHRMVLLALGQDDVNVFAEGLRDLGLDLSDTGRALLDRVAEIDATDGVPTGRQSQRVVEVSSLLTTLAERFQHETTSRAASGENTAPGESTVAGENTAEDGAA